MLLLAGCTPSALPSRPAAGLPAPLSESASSDWAYAVRVLALGDLTTARDYLERAASEPAASPSDRAQMYRDLAEVRLALMDRQGAAAAVQVSADALGQEPLNARFTAAERRHWQRTLDALLLAAKADTTGLRDACASPELPPAADACYLLGWTYEQAANWTAARVAYQAYLERSPVWSFLRRAPAMREHARAFVPAGSA